MESFTRRLPIYLLLDCSESMAGDAIRDLQNGVSAMIAHLQGDPQAIETAYLSVITFATEAHQAVPLTEVLNFRMPPLTVRTGSALGAALKLLVNCMRREVRKTTSTQKGDYKPLVILLTDGQPTDDYEDIAEEIRKQRNPSIANIYAIGCGPDADTETLREVTDIVLRMKDVTTESWKKLFIWLSASVQSTSVALAEGREGQNLNLPALPADALEVAPRTNVPYEPRQVFLHGRCGKSGEPYLMRFAKRPGGYTYVALTSHPMEVVEKQVSGRSGNSINTSQLEGVPACPYCENPVAVACDCGTLVCHSGNPSAPFRCPACRAQGQIGGGGSGFDVSQAQG